MRSSRLIRCIIWSGVLVLFLNSAAWSQQSMFSKAMRKDAVSENDDAVSISRDLSAERIDAIVAGLSDEQVRRLLIDELKRRAKAETAAEAEPQGMAGLIEKIRNLTVRMQARVELLRNSGGAAYRQASGIYAMLGTGARGTKSVAAVILSVAAVLAGGLLIQWMYALYTAPMRSRIASTVPSGWGQKIGALGLRALMDIVGILVLIIAVLTLFFLFLDRTNGQRVLLAAYLTGLVCAQIAWLVSRFFLSPKAPALRILPFGDGAAMYLHRWLLALVVVIAFGNVTVGVIGLAGATELTILKAGTPIGVIAAGMLIFMILQKREPVAAAFVQGLPESSLGYRLASKWHHFAVLAVLVLLAAATSSAVLGVSTGQARWTLLMLLLYFLLDWMLRSMLDAAFGIVAKPRVPDLPETAQPESAETPAESPDAPSPAEEKAMGQSVVARGRLDLETMKGPLKTALRLALAALVFFWILKIWSIDIPVGEAVAKAAMKILTVVLVCYIAYSIANAAIMRRLKQEMPDQENEDAEEGGAGGSRIGTLLMLLRKFMLVVIIVMAVLIILSALGVDIGPLIAGAGVFGLAIGFGAQTLVKDIISGVFFLIDDAIRVGDYVECGTAKGMVEHISIRSLRLRHPRGPVHILPFGDIKNVTNLSRDYVIMKLDFRVRYDADVDKIRKIIKKQVYKPIMKDPELGPKLLEPIKSQGVRQLDDSAMVMRVKYKTRPGDQFVIRKEVYRLMQEAFKAEGIEFAHRNVTVYMPPEVQQAVAQADAGTQASFLTGAAGALAAVAQEDAEQMADKAQKKE